MAQITREIKVDVAVLNRFAAIVAKQYDKQSRFLKVQLLNQEVPLVVERSATVVINARREDGVAKSFAGTVNDDGTVTVPLTYWMLELDGTVKCDISILVGETSMLTTTLFELLVEEAAADDEAISEDEDYGLLMHLINDTKRAVDSADTATANANTATENAVAATTAANTATENANQATEDAVAATRLTTTATENATAAALSANNAAQSATAATAAANSAAQNATSVTQSAEQAVKDCEDAVAAVQLVTQPFFIVDTDNHKQYTAAVQVQNGKPVLIYDEFTTN